MYRLLSIFNGKDMIVYKNDMTENEEIVSEK